MLCRLLLAVLCGCSLLPRESASQERVLARSYRLGLEVDKAGAKTSRTFPVDVYVEKEAGRLIYVGDRGKWLAVAEAGNMGDDKPPKKLYRLVLPVRTWDEEKVGERTRKFNVAVYRDETSGLLVYISETGALAVEAGEAKLGDRARPPTPLYRMRLKVRQPGDGTPQFPILRCNVEVYRDENTGQLLYIAEGGAIAIAPGGAIEKPKPAVFSHGVALKARGYDEPTFRPETARIEPETYRDENAGNTVYITSTLRLAVARGYQDVDKLKSPEWLRCVTFEASKQSAEVFHERNHGHLLYVTAAGGLAAESLTPRGAHRRSKTPPG
jgi:hypothetical protein